MRFVRTAVYRIPVDKATQELVLEVLRWVVFVAVSAVVTELLGFVTELDSTMTTAAFTVVLRASDRWLYEHRKQAPKVKDQ